jgi:hypothetical protein
MSAFRRSACVLLFAGLTGVVVVPGYLAPAEPNMAPHEPSDTSREPSDAPCRCSAASDVGLSRAAAAAAEDAAIADSAFAMSGGTMAGATAGFVENLGQWPPHVRFAARVGDLAVRFERGCLALARPTQQRAEVVRLVFEGADRGARVRGEHPLAGRRHFLYGPDPSRWVRGARAFRSVRADGAYPGIGVRLRTNGEHPEFDLLLEPGAALESAQVRVEIQDGAAAGAGRTPAQRGIHMAREPDGALAVRTPGGVLRLPPPAAWMVAADGSELPVECGYALLGEGRFGFRAPAREPSLALVVDPALVWASFVGGTRREVAYAVAAHGDAVLAAGTTVSLDFPATPGALATSFQGGPASELVDAWIARFDAASGNLEWATYLGGGADDFLTELEVLVTGEPIVSGWTSSTDFPTTPGAFDTTYNGAGGPGVFGGDVFVTKLLADGSGLAYSTLIGGEDIEYADSMDVDSSGAATISGHVHSRGFPTTPGAFSREVSGNSGNFITRISPEGDSLLFSTYCGGRNGEEYGRGLAVAPNGDTIVVGNTSSSSYPVTAGASQTIYLGGPLGWAEAYATRIDPQGGMVWSTFLGSPGDERARGVAVDPQGDAWVAGVTTGASFFTTAGALDRTHNGGEDIFLVRLDGGGRRLLYSTFLGGSADERPLDMTGDGAGGVLLAGRTRSPDFPTTPGSVAPTPGGGSGDGFVLHVDAAGARLLYSSYLGGPSFDEAIDVELGTAGGVALAGITWSQELGWLRGNRGGGDGWAMRLDPLATGLARFGTATPGCAGAPWAGATAMPQVGSSAFSLTCGRAPGGALGALLLGGRALASPLRVLGAGLWLDPTAPLFAVPAAATALQGAEVALPIPGQPALAGATVHAQWLWTDGCASGGWAASNALAVTVQP